MKKGVFDELKDNFLKDGKSLEKPYKAYKESLKLFGFEDFSLSKSINDSSSKIKDVSENSSDEDIDLDEFDKKRKMDEIRRLTNNKHWWNKRNHEPRKGILSDDEILKYAGDSVAASEIRLKRGIGSYSDKTNVNQDNTLLIFGWFAILYFGMMLFIGIIGESIFGLPLVYSIILLILFFILLAGMVYYTIYLFYIKDYTSLEYKKQHGEKKVYDNKNSRDEQAEKVFFYEYEKTASDLEELYQVKEKLAMNLIEKRFSSESMTYDRFTSAIYSSRGAFYNHLSSIFSIIEASPDDNLTLRKELDVKISVLKAIVGKVDELTNELVINLSQSEVDDDVKDLLDDMESLIDSVKDYK